MKTSQAILFSLLFLLGAASVTAQSAHRPDRPDPAERAEKQAERMATVLDLTPEQTARVKEINESFAQQAAAEREEMRKHRESMREERKAALKSVLTEEQFAKMEALHAQRMERRNDRDGDRPAKNRGKRGSGRDRK